MAERLPLSHGGGCVFLVAENIENVTNSRIGASWDGRLREGSVGQNKNAGCGYGGGSNPYPGAAGNPGEVGYGGFYQNSIVPVGYARKNNLSEIAGEAGSCVFMVIGSINTMDAISSGGGGSRVAANAGVSPGGGSGTCHVTIIGGEAV